MLRLAVGAHSRRNLLPTFPSLPSRALLRNASSQLLRFRLTRSRLVQARHSSSEPDRPTKTVAESALTYSYKFVSCLAPPSV